MCMCSFIYLSLSLSICMYIYIYIMLLSNISIIFIYNEARVALFNALEGLGLVPVLWFSANFVDHSMIYLSAARVASSFV